MAQVLPFYLVCDESASMRGEPINAINDCLPDIHSEIGSNPVVADKTRFCVIGFSGTARTVLPLADLSAISAIPAIAHHRGGTNYTAAFELLYDTIVDDVGRLKANGDQVYRPAVFFLSDGRPNDKKWLVPHQRVTHPGWPMHPNILAFGFGKAKPATLQHVATVRAFIADKGMGPGAALREFATSLIQSIVTSGSRPASGGALTLAVPDSIPGFTALPADPI
jgi:uncharacterized protein YegL